MGRAVLKRRAPKPWGKDFMSKYKMDDNTIADTKKERPKAGRQRLGRNLPGYL